MIANGANEIRPPYAIKRIINARINWLDLSNHNQQCTLYAHKTHGKRLRYARLLRD